MSCGPRKDVAPPPATPQPAALIVNEDEPDGLRFRLSEGVPEAGAREKLPRPATTKLSAGEIEKILARLPALVGQAADKVEFALREKSLPPPRTGTKVDVAFPQTGPPPGETPTVGPLHVLRHQPDGDVPIAARMSVTFDQPMIAVTSHDDAVKTLPLTVSPEPKGKWRWVGTKTLVFEAEADKADRFPMATEYKVTVPAGTKSAIGGTLAAEESFTFRTPPPTLVSMYPQGGPQRLDPVIWVEFDQKIDPAAILERMEIHAGGRTMRARTATPSEIEVDPTVRAFAKAADDDARHARWVAARVDGLLPPDTDIEVVIPDGTPSAEGPLKTDKDQSFSFRTYGPMKVVEARCGWNEECPPLSPWYIRFSNPIDAKKFDNKGMVKVSPEVKGLKVAVYGDGMEIYGLTKGRTTYELTLTASIPDTFGQTLGSSYEHTFRVGSAPEALSGSGEGFVTLDPVGPPRYSVYTINYKKVKVHAWKVEPSDWPKYLDYMKAVNYDDKEVTPPGKLVLDDSVSISGEADEIAETRIDLTKALPGGFGQAIVIIEPPNQPKNRWERRYVRAWVQATQIGVTAAVDATDLYGLATSLADGAPLGGVKLSIEPGGGSATTVADGTAVLALAPTAPDQNHPSVLVATRGTDTAILPENTSWWGGGTSWFKRDYGTGLGWYTFDDRNLYKPGEEVKVKGWIRQVSQNKGGDLMPLGGAVSRFSWKAMDSYGNEVAKGEDTVNALGGFDFAFKLPKTMNLGNASVQMQVVGGTYAQNSSWLYFQVEEFRRPEFEVSAQAGEGPYVIGGHAIASVKATYYAGGALPDAETSWQVVAQPGWFSPPGWDEFTFGSWRPWWIDYYDYEGGPGTGYQAFSARTDGNGEHHLRLDFDGVKPARPYVVRAEASVTDVNRQQWSASASMLVHPASVYVGLKSDRLFVQAGETFTIDSIVAGLDGKAVAGRPVERTFVLLDWEQENGEWVQKEKDPVRCDNQSEAKPTSCKFTPKEGGTYRLTATVTDEGGHPNKSELTLWVAGGKTRPERGVVQEQVTLIPNQKEYRGGDTAQILVSAPFWPAEGTMTIRRSGIVKSERITLREASTTLRIPIEEGYTPNVYVQVDLVGAAERVGDDGARNPKLPKRPAFASGQINLSVPPYARTLALTATPRDAETEPGASTEVDVVLKDKEGQPVVGAEVAVVIVDEAVLALTGYALPDPIAAFYNSRSPGASDYHMRSSVLLANPLDVLGKGTPGQGEGGPGGGAKDKMMREMEEKPAEAPAPAAAQPAPPPKAAPEKNEAKKESGGEDNAPIQVRTNFDALATFAAELPTDAAGRTHVAVKLPDSLTRYRVMAVAASATGKQFGKGESTITARLPLMVRPSAPRFLNFGDRFELPVVLQNQTNKPMTVDVAARSTNATLTDAAGLRVTVPAKDRVEVRFPAAAEMAGTARFQFGAVSGKWADAAEISLPVWTPATTEAFATYGVVDQGSIVQPIAAPRDAVKQFGGLEITTSSTQLQALTDAVLYIVNYPFECSEQISSRVITVAALRDVLSAFAAEGLPSPDELLKAMDRDIERLRTLQNDNGGWAFWRRGEDDWPYLTIHVTHALVRAKEKGFTVPANMLERAGEYLKDIESHIPGYYPAEVRRALVGYSLYVRKRMGDTDIAKAKKLLREVPLDKHGMETVGWIYATLTGDAGSKEELAQIRKHVNNHAIEEAGTAHFVTSYADGANLLLASDRRADGILLEAMIMDDPKNDLIPKVVEGLLAHRTAGRWENTQENAFVLLALDLYFHTFEKVTPDFVARAWLGDAYAGDHKFKGRTTERANIDVPMAYLMGKPATQDLILQKDGAGRMYYRIGMNYAPSSLKLEPSDHGFTVERRYEAVDDPKDVTRDDAGVWHVKAGAKVRVRVSMVAQTRRYHVALVDPLPAGLEAMNPAIQGTATIPADPNDKTRAGGWWWGPWYEHQNLRDERAEAFTSLLWEGVYDYTYIARATTPGTFVVPPPKAEEMYHPETFGRGGTDRVVVEE